MSVLSYREIYGSSERISIQAWEIWRLGSNITRIKNAGSLWYLMSLGG